MKVSKVHAAVVAALTSATGLTFQSAFAQEGGLEEIVVTATRREQNLQEVPISIVAITGDNLTMRGLDSLEDVGQSVPNIVITGGGASTGNTSFRVRGIPNVGTYVDGVWQVGTGGFLTQEFVELDRIEVLRGPQGTMFGRDSTGGALRIWTKRPSEEFGADITATIGSLDRRDIKGTLDLPLTEKLRRSGRVRASIATATSRSQTTGINHGGIDQTVFRGDVVWAPSDTVDFRFNYQENDTQFSDPHVQDAIYDTYDEFRLQAAVTEFYGLAGMEPYNRVNQISGLPGRQGWQVGKPLEQHRAQPVHHRATVGRDELADQRHRQAPIPDGEHPARHDELRRLRQQPVLARRRLGPQQARLLQPRDAVDAVAAIVFSGSPAPTTGIRISTRAALGGSSRRFG